MSKTHSPFITVEHFLSPSVCEQIIKELAISTPTVDDKTGEPMKHERILKDSAVGALFKTGLEARVKQIEETYNGSVVSMEPPTFTQYFEDPRKPAERHGCENAKYLRKKWVKVKDIDLVGYIWLKDYNAGIPLDPRFEVYGGKLEFAAYNFSLLPQRGTLVLFPAGPHFITAISPVLVGSLEQVKVTVKLKDGDGHWLYQPTNFPGTYSDWFAEQEA